MVELSLIIEGDLIFNICIQKNETFYHMHGMPQKYFSYEGISALVL